MTDCASHVCPAKGAVPPCAQRADRQAMFLARLLAIQEGAPRDFRYHDQGVLVSLGSQAAEGGVIIRA